MQDLFLNIENATNQIFINGIWVYLGTAVAVTLTVAVLLALLKKLVAKLILRRPETALQLTFLWNMAKVLGVILLIVGLTYQIAPFHNISVSLLASSGLIAIVIGAASQDAVSNIVGGVFIALFKPFSVGDRIKILEKSIVGIVEDITIRHTVIRTFENSRVIVPNKIMNSAILENFHLTDSAVCNFLDVGVANESDLDLAMALIGQLAENHPDSLDYRSEADKQAGRPVVPVQVTMLGEHAVSVRASVWSADSGTGYAMLCDLRKSVKQAFDENKIRIALPVQMVRMQS